MIKQYECVECHQTAHLKVKILDNQMFKNKKINNKQINNRADR